MFKLQTDQPVLGWSHKQEETEVLHNDMFPCMLTIEKGAA